MDLYSTLSSFRMGRSEQTWEEGTKGTAYPKQNGTMQGASARNSSQDEPLPLKKATRLISDEPAPVVRLSRNRLAPRRLDEAKQSRVSRGKLRLRSFDQPSRGRSSGRDVGLTRGDGVGPKTKLFAESWSNHWGVAQRKSVPRFKALSTRASEEGEGRKFKSFLPSFSVVR